MNAREEFVGRKVRCPGCQVILTVPALPLPEVLPLPFEDVSSPGFAAQKGSDRPPLPSAERLRGRKRKPAAPVSARLILALLGGAFLMMLLIIAGLTVFLPSPLGPGPDPADARNQFRGPPGDRWSRRATAGRDG